MGRRVLVVDRDVIARGGQRFGDYFIVVEVRRSNEWPSVMHRHKQLSAVCKVEVAEEIIAA